VRLLLDTHAFLWWIQEDDRLPVAVRGMIAESDVAVQVSAVSVWELAIKAALGRLSFDEPIERFIPRQLDENRFEVRPIELRDVWRTMTLPLIHGDPFDRMLVAQAIEDSLTLVTGDRTLQTYPVDHIW
jgi:PIN domain nuclease of toxin-antitoxin system